MMHTVLIFNTVLLPSPSEMLVFSSGVFQQRTADAFWQQPPNGRRDKARPYPLHAVKKHDSSQKQKETKSLKWTIFPHQPWEKRTVAVLG